MEISNSPVRFICIALVSIVAVNVFWSMATERSNTETLYRINYKRGILADLKSDFRSASYYWRDAIDIAKKLGGHDRDIADLYFKLSICDEKKSFNYIAMEDARQAISYYKKVSGTNNEQICAEERLLSLLPLPRFESEKLSTLDDLKKLREQSQNQMSSLFSSKTVVQTYN